LPIPPRLVGIKEAVSSLPAVAPTATPSLPADTKPNFMPSMPAGASTTPAIVHPRKPNVTLQVAKAAFLGSLLCSKQAALLPSVSSVANGGVTSYGQQAYDSANGYLRSAVKPSSPLPTTSKSKQPTHMTSGLNREYDRSMKAAAALFIGNRNG